MKMKTTDDLNFCHQNSIHKIKNNENYIKNSLFFQNLNNENLKLNKTTNNFFDANFTKSVQNLKEYWNNRIISIDHHHHTREKSFTLNSSDFHKRNLFYDNHQRSATLEKISTNKWDFKKFTTNELKKNNLLSFSTSSLYSVSTPPSSPSSSSSIYSTSSVSSPTVTPKNSLDDLNHNKNNLSSLILNQNHCESSNEKCYNNNNKNIEIDISLKEDDKNLSKQQENNKKFVLNERKQNLLEKIKITENFDKYKTADSVKKKKNSIDLKRRACENIYGINTPFITTNPTGEKLNWAKRDDILRFNRTFRNSKRKIMTESNKQNDISNNKQNSNNNTMDKYQNDNPNDDLINNENEDYSNEIITNTSKKLNRKLSFKIHPTQPRKMLNGNNLNNSGSKVAALTHRFNQMINQDSSILNEVKKNGDILFKTQSHIYKIVENENAISRKNSSNSKKGNNIKRIDSFKKSLNNNKHSVKATIEKFETKNCIKVNNKPKVPDKSDLVLMQKTKVVALKNSKKKLINNEITSSTVPENTLNSNEISVENNLTLDTMKNLNNNISIIQILPTENSFAIDSEINKETTNEIKQNENDEFLNSTHNSDNINNVKININDSQILPFAQNESMNNKTIVQDEVIYDIPKSISAPSSLGSTIIQVNSNDTSQTNTLKKSSNKKGYGSRIYEKIRLKFSHNNKKSNSTEELPKITSSTSLTNLDYTQSINITSPITDTMKFYEISENPDQKIVDALCTVNQKIDNLSRSFNDLSTTSSLKSSPPYYDKDDILPNESFLFRTASKNSFGSESYMSSNADNLVEAVNTCLVSKTQSMDETKFPNITFMKQMLYDENLSSVQVIDDISKQTDELISKILIDYDSNCINDKIEDDYEVINKPNDDLINENQPPPVIEDPITIENIYDVPKRKSDNIYQSITEVKYATPKGKDKKFINTNQDTLSENSYESYDNYEKVLEIIKKDDRKVMNKNENGYELCNPPPEPPPPNRKIHKCDEIEKEGDRASPNYEKIQYESTIKTTIQITEAINEITIIGAGTIEENIYDTIRQMETQSITSNCYESIGSITRHDFIRANMLGKHSDSMSTLSSEHKTNSLYGTAICQSITPQSEGNSDNSDEWIDISDGEEKEENRFIVTRQRMKAHRSPEWSRKIRDQKKHDYSGEDPYEDDSDHHYESLYPKSLGKNSDLYELNLDQSGKVKKHHHSPHNITSYALNDEGSIHDEEFDSFDSDGDSDEDINKKHDSGVDISNTKLPELPPTSNSYGFMKKIKNLGQLSEMTKSLVRMGKKKSSKLTSSNKNKLQNDYNDNSSTYYEETIKKSDYQNILLNTNKIKSQKSTDPYENLEFHSPRSSVNNDVINTSSPKISTPNNENDLSKLDSSPIISPMMVNANNNLIRKKSKKGTSFRSKLRKSFISSDNLNIGTSLSGTRSTFYVSETIEVVDNVINSNSNNNSSQNENIENDMNYSTPKIIAPPRRKHKQYKSPESNRRKSLIGRPNDPPPPPPPLTSPSLIQMAQQNNIIHNNNNKNLKQKRYGKTSWYAECGVFKEDSLNVENNLIKTNRGDKIQYTTSWYADAGLYQTSGDSIASSSGSSGVSTGGEGGPGDDNNHSMFLNEPLYQIYNAAKLESISREIMEINDQSSDGYEEVGKYANNKENKIIDTKKTSRPSALQLIEPKHGPSRTLWCEIPEVVSSGILETLTTNEKKLQEAKFEILTSEASYLKSLNLLKTHFMNHPAFRDSTILSPASRKILFSNVIPVLECSDRLLCHLESCWQDNIMLLGLSKSIYKNAEKYFHVYVTYCEHQGKLDRTLKKLKEQKGMFAQKLEQLESDPICCGLSFHSFLMLPMQRITRLPLLIDAVLGKLKATDEEFESWKMALAIVNKTVQECNDAANRCAQAYEIEEISSLIEFPCHIPPIPIIPVGFGARNRILIRKGELALWKNDDGKLTFGKKFTKLQKEMTKLYAFLFTDLLVLTKKKADGKYQVIDYCQRSMLTLSSGEVIPQHLIKDMALNVKYLMLMTLLENYDKKTVEMIISCSSETERQRWLQATEPPTSENPDEKLYEQWDCPQVIANHLYHSTQPDELSLDIGDVVNVTRKMVDGWYHGERLRDGVQGWFPGNYTEEVASPHVRAKNLKQRHRLLVFSANYLESQKKSP